MAMAPAGILDKLTINKTDTPGTFRVVVQALDISSAPAVLWVKVRDWNTSTTTPSQFFGAVDTDWDNDHP